MRILYVLFILLSVVPLRAEDTAEARKLLRERGIDKIVFVKRFTYTASNYYTEHVNSAFLPGGNICVLDLETGEVQDLCPELKGGMFERFDLNFDATKIAFAWKKSLEDGYRIYEVGIDGRNLKQILPAPPNEERLVKLYKNWYHHGTDDLSPCYLPDGDFAFVSSRCQYGITCDAPDVLTTTVLYRCAPDGSNLKKLSSSAVSESSPICMSNGQILYTRWEYVDKGSASGKALWAMNPDGTNSVEIFGNNISSPPTFLHGREIPKATGHFVFTGGPHSPYSAFGPINRVDTNGDIRTNNRMESMTPYVDIKEEVGWEFLDKNEHGNKIWYTDRAGHGPLFKEAWPLDRDTFIVSHKPKGKQANDPKGYGLYLLDSTGKVLPIYQDAEISCWNPVPVLPRPTPPIISNTCDPELAQRKLAKMFVADVYHGMENIERGDVKYLRILEQVPRPWSARRWDFDDEYGQQHAVITKGTHLVLKVLHGVVPVEEDGSARYFVPAEANIFVQALDKNYAALQTERTYIHSMPGETRSCIGCHEKRPDVSPTTLNRQPVAFRNEPNFPKPQPGDPSPQRVIDYVQDVQPIWDKHCIQCHGPEKSESGLRLDGEHTRLFNISYEMLVPDRYEPEKFMDRDLVGQTIGEHHPKVGNTEYMKPKTLGSHTSVLASMLSNGNIILADEEKQKRVQEWHKNHLDIKLSNEERIRFQTWIDTNCQYYGDWFGRRNIKFKDRRDYRPPPVFRGKNFSTTEHTEDTERLFNIP